jgi:hypothetical protein
MLSSARICECNSGLCVKNSLCNYDPKTDPYQSSSGIDMNEYEKNEHFGNIGRYRNNNNRTRNRYNYRNRNNNFTGIISLIIICIFIFFFYNKNLKNKINLK